MPAAMETSVPATYTQIVGDGSARDFTVPFPYLLKSHVKLYFGLSLKSGNYDKLLVDGTDYTWTTGTVVRLTTAPPTGTVLTIRRETPTATRLVQWSDGSTVTASDLNTADLQNFYVVQEMRDYSGNINVGTITFAQDGTGAVERSLGEKLKELVSVKDYGAVGNNVTDDTAAIQAAVNAAKRVYVPYGNYKISAPIVLSESRSALIGDSQMPRFTIAAGAGPAVKIIATSGGGFNEFSTIENIQFWCTYTRGGDIQSYSSNPTAEQCGILLDGSAATAATAAPVQRAQVKNCRVNGFSCGINIKNTVNTLLEHIFIESNDESRTTYPFPSNLTSANKYIGVNFDLTKHAQAGGLGISPQASIEVVNVVINQSAAPPNTTSIGFRIEGEDPRDIFFDRCETAGGMHGWYIKPTSSNFNIDVHIRRPIIDMCAKSGIYIENWLGYGALNIEGGYILKAGGTVDVAHIWINNSRGVIINGMQILGLFDNSTQDDGVRIKNSKNCSVTGNLFQNCCYAISLQNSSYCTVTGNNVTAYGGIFEPKPVLNEAIRLFEGTSFCSVTGNSVTGASTTNKYSVGINVLASSPSNFIVSNIVSPETVNLPYNIVDLTTSIVDSSRIYAKGLKVISPLERLVLQGDNIDYPIVFANGSGTIIGKINNSGVYSSGAP